MKNFSKSIFAVAAMTVALSAHAGTGISSVSSNIVSDVESLDSGDLVFDKFDMSLGTLTGVTVELKNTLRGSVTVINNHTSGATSNYWVTAGGQLDADFGAFQLSASDQTTVPFALNPGQTGYTPLSWFTTGSVSYGSGDAQLSLFLGGGQYHGTLTGVSNTDNDGTSNVTYSPELFMDGQVKVTYTYTTAVPEPETYAMLLAGLGLVGAIARRRKSA